jgi:hypothetical protein
MHPELPDGPLFQLNLSRGPFALLDGFANGAVEGFNSIGCKYCFFNLARREIMRRIQGRSSAILFESFSNLKKCYWGRYF